jgi:adenosylhomocysteine nucleosidase
MSQKFGIDVSHWQGSFDFARAKSKEEVEHRNPEYNVIDMEAFALAKISASESIDFLCFKYISDGADGSAADDWTVEVKKAAVALRKVLDSLS